MGYFNVVAVKKARQQTNVVYFFTLMQKIWGRYVFSLCYPKANHINIIIASRSSAERNFLFIYFVVEKSSSHPPPFLITPPVVFFYKKLLLSLHKDKP
jgi:hypothetical protein